MTAPRPRDRELLKEASSALDDAVQRWGLPECADTRLRLLEGAAAHVGGYSLSGFDAAIGRQDAQQPLAVSDAASFSQGLSDAVRESPLPPSLALAVLGDSDLDAVTRRRQGQYFTDSRLAQGLASGIRESALAAESILDPACGAGVLLVATAQEASSSRQQLTHIVRDVLWGVDLDWRAVRAARAAIGSLTDDLRAIACVCKRLIVADSLTVGRAWWIDHAPCGFGVVVANPPWEKLRVTRHEHALDNGHTRHYGAEYRISEIDAVALRMERRLTHDYRDRATKELYHQGRGSSDLYKMFLELGAAVTSDVGALAFLVPAGFIRNRGDRELRQWLFSNFDSDIEILDNRERYFEIDSRFKFLKLFAKRSRNQPRTIRFSSGTTSNDPATSKVATNLGQLGRISPDLALPEVKNRYDWEIYKRITRSHPRFGEQDSEWCVQFCREVDMTNDRPKFHRVASSASSLPVIEGRMVHHHRVAAKRYISGTGRRAEWSVQPPIQASLKPQWFIHRSKLRPRVHSRVDQTRAGFCDITGQTNERTFLAALIPPGVVCGNKVPTLDLPSSLHAQVWVGIANSFVFDWLVRRSVTTTLNFFIVRNMPIPRWNHAADVFIRIAAATQYLADMERAEQPDNLWAVAELRAEIEVLAASQYGISVTDLDHMLTDFPQVDRVQPALQDEARSTISRDLIVASGHGWATRSEIAHAASRVALAKSLGAVPFLPNEHARAFARAA